jgi:hypothetical protein
MPKPKLTVIAGAGSSITVGVPGTEDLTHNVRRRFLELAEERSYWGGSAARFLDLVDSWYNPTLTLANFEEIFQFLEEGISLREECVPVRALFGAAMPPNIELHRCFLDFFTQAVFEGVLYPSQIAESYSGWGVFGSFWKRLESEFDLQIYTLNYDPLIERVLGWGAEEQGFQPHRTGVYRFCPTNPPKLMHLHGSFHFGPNPEDPEELYWYETEEFRVLHWNQTLPSGRIRYDCGIVTGLDKVNKLSVEPYWTYHHRYSFPESGRLLVVGYGYGDPHINSIFRAFSRDYPNRKTVMVDYDRGRGWIKNGSDYPDLFQCMGLLSGDPHMMQNAGSENPIRSSNSNSLVYRLGIPDVVQNHMDELIHHLSSGPE